MTCRDADDGIMGLLQMIASVEEFPPRCTHREDSAWGMPVITRKREIGWMFCNRFYTR